MICKKCKSEIQESWVACPVCGKVLKKKKPATKRGNKQGCVYKRGNTWTVRVNLATYMKDGKLCRERPSKSGFATRTEALAYIAKLTDGQIVQAPTLQHYWETFRDGKMKALSDSKQTAYKIAWKRLEDLAGKKIDKLTVAQLQAVINDECETYYPARDVKVLLSHLFGVSPFILWHSLCMAPSSVTEVWTEEREEGKVSFRASRVGDLSHLDAAGVEPSFSARFCSCYKHTDERH